MARLIRRMGPTSPMGQRGEAVTQTGLTVPESGFFGKEFTLDDLGKVIQQGRQATALAKEALTTPADYIAKALDARKAEAARKKLADARKAQGATGQPAAPAPVGPPAAQQVSVPTNLPAGTTVEVKSQADKKGQLVAAAQRRLSEPGAAAPAGAAGLWQYPQRPEHTEYLRGLEKIHPELGEVSKLFAMPRYTPRVPGARLPEDAILEQMTPQQLDQYRALVRTAEDAARFDRAMGIAISLEPSGFLGKYDKIEELEKAYRKPFAFQGDIAPARVEEAVDPKLLLQQARQLAEEKIGQKGQTRRARISASASKTPKTKAGKLIQMGIMERVKDATGTLMLNLTDAYVNWGNMGKGARKQVLSKAGDSERERWWREEGGFDTSYPGHRAARKLLKGFSGKNVERWIQDTEMAKKETERVKRKLGRELMKGLQKHEAEIIKHQAKQAEWKEEVRNANRRFVATEERLWAQQLSNADRAERLAANTDRRLTAVAIAKHDLELMKLRASLGEKFHESVRKNLKAAQDAARQHASDVVKEQARHSFGMGEGVDQGALSELYEEAYRTAMEGLLEKSGIDPADALMSKESMENLGQLSGLQLQPQAQPPRRRPEAPQTGKREAITEATEAFHQGATKASE